MELAGSPTGVLPVNPWGPLSALACMNNHFAQAASCYQGRRRMRGLQRRLDLLWLTTSEASTWRGRATGAPQEWCRMLCLRRPDHRPGSSWRSSERYWWQSPVAGATQRKASAAMCQGNLETQRTEDKARQEEHKRRCRSLAAVSPRWFLKTKQARAGWILSKKQRTEVAVQNTLLEANSNMIPAGPEGSRVRPNILNTILSHEHK